jgi:hypothetical protein
MEKEIKKDIQELKKLGLSEPGFKIPENYFEEFSDKLFSKITENSIPKETGFKAPNTYFDDLEDAILFTVEKTTNKRKTKIRLLTTISSIAAALLLYLGIAKYKQSNSVTFDSITVTDIQAYIEAGNMSIDTYALASIDETINLDELLENSLSDKEINAYLNTVDTEFIFINK